MKEIDNCQICNLLFENPVIMMDGNVYCETCIKEWNKKHDKSPSGGIKSDKTIKCQLFDKLYEYTHSINDLNLLKLIEIPEFECDDSEEALELMNMIDREESYRQQKKQQQEKQKYSHHNVKRIFEKIFENGLLINSLIRHLSDQWIGKRGINISYYVLKYGSKHVTS